MSKDVRALLFLNLLVYEEVKYNSRFIVYITAFNKSMLLHTHTPTHTHTHPALCNMIVLFI